MKHFAGLIAVIVGCLMITAIADFPQWGDPYSPANNGVARYYLEHSMSDSNVPNVVTSVLADYRGFDTMFETAVVFVAGLAILFLLRQKKKGTRKSQPASLIVRVAARIMIPFIQLFGLYVIAHGHHSPGGGFQGGVILGASLILLAIAFDIKTAEKRISEKKLLLFSAIGVLIFSGIGAICILLGGNFLDYSVWAPLLPATDTVMARSHGMLAVEVGVALTVMCGMMSIYVNIASDGRKDHGL